MDGKGRHLTSMTLLDRRAVALECDLVAQSAFRASPGEMAGLRKSPGADGGPPTPPALLRHSDEQTVVGLAAVLRAIASGGLDPDGFGDWAVLVAPRFLGRAAFERAFPQFRDEGAWGVSPHLIPAHSLHSPSGTISQALKAHGLNLGIGGTPGGEAEALLLAATLLGAGSVAGVWVVLTGRSEGGDPAEPGSYEALALALAPPARGRRGPRLRIAPGSIQMVGAGPDGGAVPGWAVGSTVRADAGHARVAAPVPHFRIGAGRPAQVDDPRDLP